MNENFLLNKKTQRQDDLIQNENDIKMDDKNFEQVKPTNETSKIKEEKGLKKSQKNIFIINNLKNDKKKKLIDVKNDKKSDKKKNRN